MDESVQAMSTDFVVHGRDNDRVVILNQAVTWLLTIDGNVTFEGQSSYEGQSPYDRGSATI